MKKIFERPNFPIAPGGDRYEWFEAKTTFSVHAEGIYVLQITAEAKNGEQNKSGDDDDLRIGLNGYEFGKYELHEAKISWKGFGTSSAWDGASLKGNSKTNFYFFPLDKGEYAVSFFADCKPTIQELIVYELETNESFHLGDITPPRSLLQDGKARPFLSFTFLGDLVKELKLRVVAQSANQKGSTDGDDLKITKNGTFIHNEEAPTSRKYKNSYFAGDLSQGQEKELQLFSGEFDFFENSIELWYDQSPKILECSIDFYHDFSEIFRSKGDSRGKVAFYKAIFSMTFAFFAMEKEQYTELLLRHALKESPGNLTFDNDHPFTEKLKKDSAYQKALSLVQEELNQGRLEGDILTGSTPRTTISFESHDLQNSIHGIKRIHFKAVEKANGKFEVSISFFDVFDFHYKTLEENAGNWQRVKTYINNVWNEAEFASLVKDFEIVFKTKEFMALPYE